MIIPDLNNHMDTLLKSHFGRKDFLFEQLIYKYRIAQQLSCHFGIDKDTHNDQKWDMS